MLLALKDYCKKNPKVTLRQIATAMQQDESVVEGMMQQLIRKKWVTVEQKTSFCQTKCFHCPTDDTVVYVFKEKQAF